jgi:hypothetical protein
MKTAEQRIHAAIQHVKTHPDFTNLTLRERIKILNKAAAKFKIKGLMVTNSPEFYITGWTARVRVTG